VAPRRVENWCTYEQKPLFSVIFFHVCLQAVVTTELPMWFSHLLTSHVFKECAEEHHFRYETSVSFNLNSL
jgi:hypothetical protein